MSLAPGTKLGAHEIVELIGEGGMGQVYRARDARLDRDVAIKVLPELLAEDPERVGRFRREAKLLASLSHSNVAAIHGFDEEAGRRFLVMELVEGESLDQRLRLGPLETTAALEVARQVAEGLEAAHAKGIVHRDLKPANVRLRPDGQVKVLDFGLAKALRDEPEQRPLSHSPTIATGLTHEGMILGTAAYLSPEQARGREVDARADVWAFGALLYEMLTGRRAFGGETPADCIGAVLHAEPDWSALPADTPAAAQLLLRRCLTKDPRRRLHAIADARIELESCLADPNGSSTLLVGQAFEERAARRPRRSWALVVAALLGGLAAGLLAGPSAWRALTGPEPPPPVRKFDLGVAVDDSKGRVRAEISLDGSAVTYSQEERVWVQALDELEPRALDGVENASWPFWSPDARHVAFFKPGELWRAPASGGAPRLVCELSSSEVWPGGGVWGEDDQIVFSILSEGLLTVDAGGGTPRVLVPLESEEQAVYTPTLLPDGRGLLFASRVKQGPPTRIEVLADGRRRVIFSVEAGRETWRPRFSPSGHVIFRQGENLWAMPFSLSRLEAEGEPFFVQADAWAPSVSEEGTLVFLQRRRQATVAELAMWDPGRKELEPQGQRAKWFYYPRLSPDGRRLVSLERVEEDVGETSMLWLRDLERGTRLSLAESDGMLFPSGGWTPDGRWVLFSELFPPVRCQAFAWPTDGSGSVRPIAPGLEAEHVVLGVTPDGRQALLVESTEEGVPSRWWLAPLEGDGPAVPVLAALQEFVTSGELSPDGRLVAFSSPRSGRDEVYLARFPSGEGLIPVSVSGGVHPRWSRDGRRLFFSSNPRILSVEVGDGLELSAPKTELSLEGQVFTGGDLSFDVASGDRLLVTVNRGREGEARAAQALKVVQHWASEFVRD